MSIEHTWISSERPPVMMPVRQVYVFALDSQRRVLVQRDSRGRYNLPGGKPEPRDCDELATLRRECMEESQFRFCNEQYLGYLRIGGHAATSYAQLRYLADVAHLSPTSIDPATGETYERLFIELADVNHYLRWGEHGRAQVAAAVRAATTRAPGQPRPRPAAD